MRDSSVAISEATLWASTYVGVDLLTNKAFSWKLPGGSGQARPILAHPGRPRSPAFSHASRVSCSEVFGSNPALDNMSTLTYTGRTWAQKTSPWSG